MIYKELSYCLSKNLNRIFSLKHEDDPEKILIFLLKELETIKGTPIKQLLLEIEDTQFTEWYNNIFHLNFLKELILKDVNEIILHSPRDIQVFGFNKKTKLLELPIDQELFNLAIEVMCFKEKRQFSFENSFSSFQTKLFQKNIRFSVAHNSTTNTESHRLFCRILSQQAFELKEFCLNPKIEDFLNHIAEKKYNVVIAGATSSGKTSLIRSQLNNISQEEHIVIIEDTKELETRQRGTTHLISREGRNEDIQNYCHQLLRMRPDRIVLGEIRSSEVIPLLLNLNCGHKGLLTTIHANSAIDTIDRIGTLIAIYGKELNINYEQTLNLICQNLDFIIHMKHGKISEIIQILGNQNQNIQYEKVY